MDSFKKYDLKQISEADIERLRVRLEEIFRSPTQEEIAASIAELKGMGFPLGEIVELEF